MADSIKFTIDSRECYAAPGQTLVDAAKENGVYIPTLCNYPGLKPKGSCRICTVKVNGRRMTACTTPVTPDMQVENDTDDLNGIRKQIVEVLLVSGNHFCPACEKSGDCELQALAYRFRIMAPRFPFAFPQKKVDASHPLIIKEQNRCIVCKRCIRGIRDEKGRGIFAMRRRGYKTEVVVDPVLGAAMSREQALAAMEICPVGSILVREQGFSRPIGTRKYDRRPIGSDVEGKEQA